MVLNIIVAMTRERVIGKDGQIPWRIPDDVNLFKRLTTNNIVIMGRNTWLSIPEKFRPLPDRLNIIVSSTMKDEKKAMVCKSVGTALEVARKSPGNIFCIGGAQLYESMLPLAEVLHISWIKKSYDGNTYFPEVNFEEWEVVEEKDFEEFTYKRYIRKPAKPTTLPLIGL